MLSISLTPKRDWSVRRHHPWIFSGAIARADVEGIQSGETVAVCDAKGATLGYGSYSPASQIRVRMLSFDPAVVPDAAFVQRLVAAAVARRADFFDAASPTNACRLIHAENDGLPGVVADVYAGFVVCQFTSAGAEHWKPAIVAALMESVPGCRGVSERADLKDREKEGLPVAEAFTVLTGEEPPVAIEIFEGPCKFFVDVRRGHKTGFYLDQRDARAAVGALAKGRTVLNCFCYTGGFGLAAAAGGASHVTQVDISGEVLALARQNENLQARTLTPELSTLSPQPPTRISYVEADVFQYLRRCRDAGRTFDLIVLDPPKFASVKSQVMKAARGYKDINLLAMKLLNPGGFLATFSCSGAMTAELFDKVLAEAAADAGRDFQMIARTRQAADHPVLLSFPEGLYLKGVILRAVVDSAGPRRISACCERVASVDEWRLNRV